MKKFSELQIVGYVRHGKSYLTSWVGETEKYEVVSLVPEELKIWPAKHRAAYDDVVELRLLPNNEPIGNRFVLICFKDEPAP